VEVKMKVYLKSVADEGDCLPGEAFLHCIDYLGEKHMGFFDREFIKHKMLQVSIWNWIMSGEEPSSDIVEVVPRGGKFIKSCNVLRVYRKQLAFVEG